MIKRIAENFLYHIWDEQHLKESLRTDDGSRLRILYQGKWNTDAGPDFENAIILLEDEKIQGSIEIHKTTYDWHAHNHDEDPMYNKVILHVVFQNNTESKYTITESGKKIPILSLMDNLDESIEKLWKKYGEKPFDTLQRDTITCLLANSSLTQSEMQDILLDLGKKRFNRKCTRFSAELYASDFSQILYEGILEALGYAKNKATFLKLAKNLPYQKLQSLASFCDNPDDLFAIFIIASGLDSQRFQFSFFTKDLYERIDKIKSVIRPYLENQIVERDEWNFFRVRPFNHPVARTWQISPFLFSTFETNLINKVLNIFSVPEGTLLAPVDVQKSFYSLITQETEERNRAIGHSRTDDILANIVLPVCWVYAKTLGYNSLMHTIEQIYLSFPKLAENYITNFVQARLKNKLRQSKINLPVQQGMIQLYYKFCNHFECKNCLANLTNIGKRSERER
jgi:hypothetical protein